MYRMHWGLRESPFRSGLNPRFYYESPTHDEAIARLHFLVGEHQRVGLLLAESGCGKSQTLEVFARQLRRRGAQLVNLNLLGLDQHEFLWLLAADLGLNPQPEENLFSLWRNINDRLLENRYQHLDTVLLLDDVDEASDDVLDVLVRLVQSDASAACRMSMILSATTLRQLRRHSRLLELAELRIELEAWDALDTMNYLNYALKGAGRTHELFTDEAMIRLHRLSGGIPRKVAQLANLALLAGAGQGLTCIHVDTIEQVHHELGTIRAVA